MDSSSSPTAPSKGSEKKRRRKDHMWTDFEMNAVLALICSGEHLALQHRRYKPARRIARGAGAYSLDHDEPLSSSPPNAGDDDEEEESEILDPRDPIIPFAKKLNQAINGAGKAFNRDIPLHDVRSMLATVYNNRKAALCFIDRQPGAGIITRAKKRVFQRALGFDGSLAEWTAGGRREKVARERRAMLERAGRELHTRSIWGAVEGEGRLRRTNWDVDRYVPRAAAPVFYDPPAGGSQPETTDAQGKEREKEPTDDNGGRSQSAQSQETRAGTHETDPSTAPSLSPGGPGASPPSLVPSSRATPSRAGLTHPACASPAPDEAAAARKLAEERARQEAKLADVFRTPRMRAIQAIIEDNSGKPRQPPRPLLTKPRPTRSAGGEPKKKRHMRLDTEREQRRKRQQQQQQHHRSADAGIIASTSPGYGARDDDDDDRDRMPPPPPPPRDDGDYGPSYTLTSPTSPWRPTSPLFDAGPGGGGDGEYRHLRRSIHPMMSSGTSPAHEPAGYHHHQHLTSPAPYDHYFYAPPRGYHDHHGTSPAHATTESREDHATSPPAAHHSVPYHHHYHHHADPPPYAAADDDFPGAGWEYEDRRRAAHGYHHRRVVEAYAPPPHLHHHHQYEAGPPHPDAAAYAHHHGLLAPLPPSASSPPRRALETYRPPVEVGYAREHRRPYAHDDEQRGYERRREGRR
ncbi:hypothetical protein F4780DRAFT_478607 [Xylariomycetidae sp. FL0641]|nr:hypothetical protein F4780DRAFT_478607 [Xylariomycetidae sp. FL0641]